MHESVINRVLNIEKVDGEKVQSSVNIFFYASSLCKMVLWYSVHPCKISKHKREVYIKPLDRNIRFKEIGGLSR